MKKSGLIIWGRVKALKSLLKQKIIVAQKADECSSAVITNKRDYFSNNNKIICNTWTFPSQAIFSVRETIYFPLENNKNVYWYNPSGNYMLQVSNRNIKTRCKKCSKLMSSFWCCRSGVFIVNFEHTSHLLLLFLLLTLSR